MSDEQWHMADHERLNKAIQNINDRMMNDNAIILQKLSEQDTWRKTVTAISGFFGGALVSVAMVFIGK